MKRSPLDEVAQSKWDAYTEARDEMLRRTQSTHGPWICVRSDKAGTALDINNFANAKAAVDAVDAAIKEASTTRSTFGAAQSRFEAVISNLQTASENTSAARSRIMDADFAAETANLSRAQILQQAGTAMVAQANQLPQTVLALLRN